jgi:hypothetical protein
LRSAEAAAATGDPDSKLGAIRSAVSHDFPAPDVEQMLAEVEQGYIQDSV